MQQVMVFPEVNIVLIDFYIFLHFHISDSIVPSEEVSRLQQHPVKQHVAAFTERPHQFQMQGINKVGVFALPTSKSSPHKANRAISVHVKHWFEFIYV